MDMYDAGDARLRIVPDAREFRRDLEAQMKSQQAEFVVQVRADAARAREEINELRREEEARAVHLRVDTRTTRAAEQVDRMRAEQEARPLRLRVDVDESAHSRLSAAVSRAYQQAEAAAERLAQADERVNNIRRQRAEEINPLLTAAEAAYARAQQSGNADAIARSERNLSEMRKALGGDTAELTRAEEAATRARRQAVGASENLQRAVENEISKTRDLSRELGTLRKDFESAFHISHLADAFSGMTPVIGMLPALATGLAEAAAAAEQLAGASLALPGVFAGIGASLGSLLVGIHGVGDAYKTLGRAANESANDQRQHAIEVRQANDELAAATREQGEAERDRGRALRDSRQEMEDLNLELRGGKIDTAEAILEAQKARRDLVTGHYKDGLDYQEAQLRVVQADQRVAESLNNQNRLRERAADQGDRVAQANDRVAQANARVARAGEHVNDVNTKLSASQRAVNEAMAKLAPNAQDFVKTIFEITRSGPLKELQTEDQQNLFAGMGASIRTLVNADLPTLRSGMASVATSLNTDFKELFASLGSDHTKGLLDRIFGDTAHAQDLLRNAINPLVSAVGTLARAGADTLPRMADGLGRAADRFNAFISAADKDGRLDAWINGGITGFTHLGDIFVNLGQSLNGITKAIGGQGFLATLDDATKKLAAFLNSTHGQDDLRRIFADGRAELEQLKPILEALPDIFKSVFGAARDSVSAWLPLLQTAAGILKDWPGLTQSVLTGFLAWKQIGPVVSVVGDGIGVLATKMGGVQTEITNSRVLADSEMSKTAKIFSKVAGEEGVGKLTSALNTLSGIGGPVGMMAVTAAVPVVVAALDNLNRATNQARDAANQLDQQERTLEGTLDRVSGKITAATRQQAIQSSQNYNQAGAGGGIPGISQGNAIEAATKLGIPPDVYADALMGKPGAVQQVMDIISKNNLLPEFQANSALRGDLGTLATAGLSPQDLVKALIGAPGAVDKYTQAFKSHGMGDPTGTDYDLTHIAQQLSPSGQASVLAGLNLTSVQRATAGAQQQQQQGQQADYGRWRLSSQGVQDFGDVTGTQVNAADDGYHVSMPELPRDVADKLKQLNISPSRNLDGSWSFVLPLGSPDVEKYEQGGGTPHATGPLDDGGYYAVIHPSEYVVNKTGRGALGDEFLASANTGNPDPSLLPHFDIGGPGDFPASFGRVNGQPEITSGDSRNQRGYVQIDPQQDRLGTLQFSPHMPHGVYADPGSLPHFDQGGPAGEFGPTDQADSAKEQQSGSLLSAVQAGIHGAVDAAQTQYAAAQGQGGGQAGADGAAGGGIGGLFGRFSAMMPHFDVGGPGDKPTLPGLGAGLGGGAHPHLTGSSPGPALGLPGLDSSLPGLGVGLPALGGPPGVGLGAGIPDMGANILNNITHRPGLWGLAGVASSPDPGLAMQQWTAQTGNWLANWGLNTLGQLGSDLYGGALGFFGLQNSVLSPNNPWTSAAIRGVSGVLQNAGVPGAGSIPQLVSGKNLGGTLTGMLGGMGGGNPAVANFLQTGQLDASASGIPGLTSTLQSLGLGSGGLQGLLGSTPGGTTLGAVSGGMPMPAGAGITYTRDAVSKLGIPPLAMNPPNPPGGNPVLPAWLSSFVKNFGPSLTPTSTPHGALHGVPGGPDWATDVVGDAKDMDNLAGYLLTNPGLSIQLIHKSQITGKEYGIAGGANVSGSYYTTPGGTYEDELTMVHWAPSGPLSGLSPGTAGGANSAGPLGAATPGGVNPNALTAGQTWWEGWKPGNAGAALAGASGHGSAQLQQLAHAMYLQAGMPPGEWDDFNELISHESGWNPTAQNPGSTAHGLGQFLDSTWRSVGGSKTDNPVQQLAYIFQYLKQRPDYHGSPAAAWSLWQSRSPHWYDDGGFLPTGLTMTMNNTGAKEAVLTPQQTQAYQTVASHLEQQGSSGAPPQLPQVPDAQRMQPQPQPQHRPQAPQQPAIAQGPSGQHVLPPDAQPSGPGPGGAPGGRPAPPAALGPLGPQAQKPVGGPTVHGSGPQDAQGAWGPDSGMHVAPALKTGIMSTANTLGTLASTAISAAASAGSFGMGGPAAGAMGSLAAGLFNQAGKIAVNIANVPSSLLVGTLSPGTTSSPSGQTYHPSQNQPAVGSVTNNRNYGGFYGHSTEDVMNALDLRESQEQQAHLANYRAWP